MKNKIIVTLVWLLLVAGSILPNLATTHNPSPDAEIVSLQSDPYLPQVNQTVTFTTVISTSDLGSIKNVTISLVTEQDATSKNMSSTIDNPSTFKFSTSFQKPGTVAFYSTIYSSDAELDSSKMKEIKVVADLDTTINFTLPINESISIGEGHYSLTTPENNLQLSFNTTRSLNITISEISTDTLPSQSVQISNVFDISINDSEAMDNITVSLYYNTSSFYDLGADPSLLEIQKRENETTEWGIVPSILDRDNNRLVHHPVSFSQWTVTTSSPALRFLETNTPVNSTLNSYVTLKMTIGNVGGIDAKNVSLKLTIPQALILSNESQVLNVSKLHPRENQTINWIFRADTNGEYSVIATIEAENSDGDIEELKMFITPSSSDPDIENQTESSSSDTSIQNDSTIPMTQTLFMTTILFIIVRRKYR